MRVLRGKTRDGADCRQDRADDLKRRVHGQIRGPQPVVLTRMRQLVRENPRFARGEKFWFDDDGVPDGDRAQSAEPARWKPIQPRRSAGPADALPRVAAAESRERPTRERGRRRPDEASDAEDAATSRPRDSQAADEAAIQRK